MALTYLDTYLSLCAQVYDISLPTPPPEEYAFFRSYAEQTTEPILEPMCGSGRFLLPLMQEGFNIQGFDASVHMFNALRARAKRLGLTPNVKLDFIETFESPLPYGLIFIPSGSFNLITDRTEIARALKKFYALLSSEGTLVIEIITLAATPKNPGTWRREKWDRPEGGFILASSCEEPLVDNVSLTHCTHDLVVDGKVVLSEQETFHIRLYSPEDFQKLLFEAGFTHVVARKAFDRTRAPEVDDKDVIFECKK